MKRALVAVAFLAALVLPVASPASARTTLNCGNMTGGGGAFNGVEEAYAYCTAPVPPVNFTSYSVCVYVSPNGISGWVIDSVHGVAYAACDTADTVSEQIAFGDRKPGTNYYRSQSYAWDRYVGGYVTLQWAEWVN